VYSDRERPAALGAYTLMREKIGGKKQRAGDEPTEVAA